MTNKQNRYMPLFLAVSAVLGILVGSFYTSHFSGNRLSIINSGSNRLTNMLHFIDDQYVDEVNMDSLVDLAIPKILAELDPHSVYLTAKEMQLANDELKSSFSGVGIEFNIRQDTLHVQNVISNGPAERAGIIAGDKIVTVNGDKFTGKILTNEEAMRRLKGPKDTKVVLGIERYGHKKPLTFTVTRGEIPQKSIGATFMLDETTGYVHIKSFAEQTWPELLVALASLSQQGFDNLVIDLRDNSGGYLQSAVQVANEFLPKKKLIVYTQGRKSPRQEYRSDGHGSYQNIPLVVLINEGSASAAEILAGALQDNDRATVIGRRSFGKGLVQQPIEFSDGSMLRLTIARYYTPSGRCIQKPYTKGDERDYAADVINRFQHGEFFSEDSIKHTGPKYHTGLGRVVYGGGGITPDIFVAEDTLNVTSYYSQAAASGLIFQFAFDYTDNNRPRLRKIATLGELVKLLKRENIVEKFASYAEQHGLKRRNLMIQRSHRLLERYIVCRIVYNIMGEQALGEYLSTDDPVILETKRIFSEGKAFPKKTAESKKQVARYYQQKIAHGTGHSSLTSIDALA